MARTETEPKPKDLAGFFPVHIDSVDHSTLEMDLYLLHPGASEPALYRSTGVSFSETDARRLAEQHITFVYVPVRQHAIYRRALRNRLDRTFRDPDMGRAVRTKVVRASCAKMIEDVLMFPGRPEAIASVTEIGRLFSDWAATDRGGFSYLLDMSAHDYYTITHMVNVGVGCGLLAKELRPDDTDLRALLIQGGLLHDVGKRSVPEAVLNKEGKLSAEEWDLIKTHPQAGFDELAGAGVSEVILEMTRDHHEKLDGTGYPAGKRAEDISFPARLCAVVDCYDAITAARPYRGPTPPREALAIMQEGVGGQFDAEIFEAWKSLVERLIREDPQRAVREGPRGGQRPSLNDLTARPPREVVIPRDSRPAAVDATDRRQHPRFKCDFRASAALLRKGKPGGPALNQVVTLRVTDISRGGVQIQTPWPPSLNDVVLLHLPQAGGGVIARRVRIVRVRQADNGNDWCAGCCFVNDAAGAVEPRRAG